LVTDWQVFVQTQLDDGATAANDLGGPCVGCYGNLKAEYRALSDGPALIDRSYRGLLEITGRDRASWLHNLTTNEVKSLASGQGRYAFALNRQGRILFDLNIIVHDEAIHIDLDRRVVDAARGHFGKYVITEDVHAADRTDEFVRFALGGVAAAKMLEEMGAPNMQAVPQLGTTQIVWRGCPIVPMRHDFCGPLAVELFVPAAKAIELWQSLSDPSGDYRAVPVGDDAVQARRIEAGIPWPFHEITEEYLPAETRQLDRAVSFTKGCYLGQEVVGRMRSRGAVARQLVGLEIDGDMVPRPGARLADGDDKPVGQLTSVCRSLATGRVIGLGYVKTPYSDSGTSLRVALETRGVRAMVADLPFVACSRH
jgi:folate-binding protein YgfZ